MKSKLYKTLNFWLPKIPFLTLIFTLLLPIIIININYDAGLFFIALYISYWTIKVFESYFFVLKSYLSLLRVAKINFAKNEILHRDAKNLKHIVIVPVYTEPLDVIEENIKSLLANIYEYKQNITIILATEARAPDAEKNAKYIIEKYKDNKMKIVNIVHPADLPGEGKVKGANITYAIREYEKQEKLNPKRTFVSTIDTDTKVEKKFFSIVSWIFLTTDHPHQAIFQFTPLYSNNWKKGKFFARIVAAGTTIWQLFESQNPEFYRNFAVYGQSLLCLHKADYWSKTSIVEDGMQYWRAYFGWDGLFRIVHTPAICEMDVVEESNTFNTFRAQYKQLRRWSWGCSDIEYVIPKFLENKKIPKKDKIRKTFYLIQNHLFWAGGPMLLFYIGYIPGLFSTIESSLATFTVPIATSVIFTFLFLTIIFPSVISIHILSKYIHFSFKDYLFSLFQWIFLPVLMLTLFSFPAIESQFRLFLGKRIDSFDTTKKMSRN
ncbi:glycosyltransferase family 2 protein [Candidatus Gracilibacteria bacterium]|nr:glycosyltransferase family 2 protein [Candidatus Gracilibacteria bacterium]